MSTERQISSTSTATSSTKKKKKSSRDHSSSSSAPPRKAFLAGDYAVYIEEELGRGSFSQVYPATLLADPAPRGSEEFAAKYCELKDSISRDRFDEEANNVVRIHEKFQTPYVIKLIKRFLTKSSSSSNGSNDPSSSSSSASKGILIYEVCRGPSLHTLLLRNGPLPPHLVHRFLAQMVEALACCHARGCEVVHRDVKPENFLLSSPDVENAHAVLIDFGFSIRNEGREPCGTPTFMSPEVLSGNLHGPPTDIFSLGVTILCMIFGLQPSEQYGVLLRMPHPPVSITSNFVRESIDEGSPYFRLRDIVAACVETDPKKRPTAMQLRGHESIRAAGIVPAKKIGSHHHHHVPAAAATSSSSNIANANDSASLPVQEEGNSKNDVVTNSENNNKLVSDSNKNPSNENDVVVMTIANQNSNDNNNNNDNETLLLPRVEQTTAERAKNSFTLQIDGFSDRIEALLTIANTLHLPARRASICVKVARILCHEVNSKHYLSSSPIPNSPKNQQQGQNNNDSSFANTAFLSEKIKNETVNGEDTANGKNQNHNKNGSPFYFTSMGREGNIPLLEQLQWVKSQLASLMNVLPDDEPLPDCDSAVADGVKNLAGAALRAMLLGETECCYGDCVSVIRFCRIALKKDLMHYSELNSLRKKLEDFALGV